MTRLRGLLVAVSAVALVGATAACGGDDATTAEPTMAADEAAHTPDAVTVNVTVTEFAIESSLTTFEAGTPYHFVLTNSGALPHELMLMQPMAAGMMTMEEMDELAIAVVEEDDLPGGGTAEFDVTFEQAFGEGELEFSCHLPGHYEGGMTLPVIVE